MRTNGAEFDFPPYEGLPPVRYVLASAPRSGSNMLARALWHTGQAGFADGYLSDTHALDFFERWGWATADPAALTETYVRGLMRFRTSPNGVFGVNVHGEHLPGLEVDLHELLRSPCYIWLRRRDRLRQAVSYALAQQTGVWILDGTYLPIGPPLAEPAYSYAEILRCLRHLDRDERRWTDYFESRTLAPHVVFYEDLLASYEETVLGCLHHLGVEATGPIPEPGLSRQAGEVTERWLERFEHDAATIERPHRSN